MWLLIFTSNNPMNLYWGKESLEISEYKIPWVQITHTQALISVGEILFSVFLT